MNKSIITNVIALITTLAGYFLQLPILYAIGLFALSGSVTNWLAIHMLFEKIPGLYGSGVIPARFEDFKVGIRQLMMSQFFTKENIDRFLSSSSSTTQIDLTPVIDKVDLTPAFDNLVDVIEASSFGSMLAMVGGREAVEPMREPFIEKMRTSVVDITQSESFHENLKDVLEGDSNIANIQDKVSDIIEQRLNELTPQLVKEIIQDMIKKHLGWLVVWGGVFGGIIGFIAAITGNF
ncbi:hypothetical protein tloyanaT_24780 [Thalassotalea loyana]|uniref:DUF445 domain-containing protein n=1 Tax=Thalassotalea loyana TaxID=280483 RepID=A0ABQ6HFE9_9GAMM|nr:DUF445 family protein [Thalassotalea loyana]GLX86225.1 hypothetical protein tloyanaT_24780 [Thalassotalea loyana]